MSTRASKEVIDARILLHLRTTQFPERGDSEYNISLALNAASLEDSRDLRKALQRLVRQQKLELISDGPWKGSYRVAP